MSGSSTTPAVGAVDALAALLARAKSLEADLSAAAATRQDRPEKASSLSFAARRLQRSVIRPLGVALEHTSVDEAAGSPATHDDGDDTDQGARPDSDPASLLAGEPLWQQALDATRLRLSPGLPTEVQEATAALQDLVCRFEPTGDGSGSDRLAELRALQAGLTGAIQSQRNGPYLVTNVARLTNHLGESLPTRPQMALCRCGGSAIKPLCDGTHAENGFIDEKDPKRVPDRRDTYVGEQVTILDNRGTCQHSGYCTDRLATVFHADQEPFVTPSGGRMDEIIRAVRDCPSGALSYAIDGHEARAQVDHGDTRDPAVEVSKDGPYRVTGAIPLVDPDGENERRNHGASREHYALCRCGHSQNKPFCSGMHWYVDFKDPVADADHEPTIFEWCGGLPALTRMTRVFYEKYVPQDPLLAPLFANMSPDHPKRVAKWLSEVFCGPKAYSEQYGGYARMVSQHIGKGLTEEKRARWVTLILQAAQDAGLPNDPEFRSAFGSYIEWGSRLAVENSQAGARPPEHMPMPHWDWQTAAGAPGSRVSALAATGDTEEQPVVLPAKDEPVTFDKHIKTLFRSRDRQSMKFAFDLWSYVDVKAHAPDILERVQNGSMPCDGAWPPENIDAFERWVSTGMHQ
jgi:CDGSH-type Zn-finger protein/truncated hemoglobin YjbI